jgi:hypothetical protein
MKINTSKTLIAVAIGCTPVLASALTLEDYLVANSAYDEANLQGNFTAIEPAGDADNDRLGYSYSLSADYEKTFSTLPRSWSYDIVLDANGNKSTNKTSTATRTLVDATGVPILDANGEEQLETITVDNPSTNDWGVRASGVIDTYFHESAYPKAFWFGKGQFESRDSQPEDSVSATIGLGYGRVYDATPLAKVIRIVEELNAEGLLTGPIPDSIALEAAEIIQREDEFESKFGSDDYRPDFYAAIESALARSGSLRDGKLGALGAITMDDVLVDEPISVRKHGWVVRAGAGFQASDLSGIADNDPKLLFEWEYAKPYGYKGQFINSLTYEPVFGDNTIQVVSNEMSYTHEVSDTIDWTNSWRMTFSDSETTETTIHNLSTRYSFDVGSSLDYFIGLNLTQTDTDPNEPGSIGDDPEINLTSGFNYRLK